MIVETQDRNQARADHKALIDDFEKLKSNPGWIRLQQYLESEARQVFSAMMGAKEGDVMIKAVGAYTTLQNIITLPARETEASIKRLNQMIGEDKEEAQYRATLTTRRNKP